MAIAGTALELVVSLVGSTVVAAEIDYTCVSVVAYSVGTNIDLFDFNAKVHIVESVLRKLLTVRPGYLGVN